MLDVHLLGQFDIRRDGQQVIIRSRPAQTLLAYLTLTPGVRQRREKLAGMLWPDTAETTARTNLRYVLWRINQAIGDGYIEADKLDISFKSGSNCRIDVVILQQAVSPDAPLDELVNVVSPYLGDLLPGFYDSWVLAERERLHAVFEEKIAALLERLLAEERWRDATSWAERWIAVNPTAESAYCALMTAYQRLGNSAGVVTSYKRCVNALEADLGVEPSAVTQATYEACSSQPTPISVRTRQDNLPVPVTSFVGRTQDLAEIQNLLRQPECRLVTLLGAGGTGKTRLALQVATQLIAEYEEGVVWVALAAVTDPALVPATIAATLGIKEVSGQPVLQTLAEYLRRKQMLLVLDNFEQVIEAARWVGELLAYAPGIRILVTSRQVLRLTGEHDYLVPPLPIPDLRRKQPPAQLLHCEAVTLFVQRARAVNSRFQPTEDNVSAVAEMCVQLDGLPLAIELAAAQSRMLAPATMRDRLSSRLKALTSGARDLPARQQTLRATLDWSYNLLDEGEKTLFARLGVFVGGWTPEAAEAVCNPSPGAADASPLRPLPITVFDGLESLIDKSLIQQAQTASGEMRFMMLETIREYAVEKLEAKGEGRATRERHIRYYVALAERAVPQLDGADQRIWLDCLETELDNLRAAFSRSFEEGGSEFGVELAGDLLRFWEIRGYFAEGARWSRQALDQGTDSASLAYAKALNCAGRLAFLMGDYQQGTAQQEQALALLRKLGDQRHTAWALLFMSGQLAGLGQFDKMQPVLDEAWMLFSESDDKNGVAWTLNVLGELARLQGDYRLAERYYGDSLALFRELNNRQRAGLVLQNLGHVVYHGGDYPRAKKLYEEALILEWSQMDRTGTAGALVWIARVAAMLGEPEKAARLLGAAEVVFEATGFHWHPADLPQYRENVENVLAALGEEAFTSCWAEGRAMSLDEIVEYALAGSPTHTSGRMDTSGA